MTKFLKWTGTLLLFLCFAVSALCLTQGERAYASKPPERPTPPSEPMEITYRQNLTTAGELQYYLYAEGNPELLANVWGIGVTAAEERMVALFDSIALDYKNSGKEAVVTTVVGERSLLKITLAEYEDFDEFYIAQGRDGYETGESDAVRIRNGMFTIIRQTSDTVFKDMDGTYPGDLFGRICAAGVPADRVLFVHEYATKYSQKLIRTNADAVSERNGMTVHRFEMKDADRAEKQVIFYQRVPETWTWYLLALAVGAVCVGGVFGYLYYLKRRKNHGGRAKEDQKISQ